MPVLGYAREDAGGLLRGYRRERQSTTYPDGYVFKLLIQEFRNFQEEFIKHMREEETFLFPKLLRNETCFRHDRLNPQVHKGSINLYLKLETHKPEAEFKRMIASIREKLRNQSMGEAAAGLARRVQAELEAFEIRLNAHAGLETDFLFPRAGRMEQELYESSVPAFPGIRAISEGAHSAAPIPPWFMRWSRRAPGKRPGSL